MRPTSQPSHGRPVSSDPYFTLMAGEDGVGFIQCGDAVAVVPMTYEDDVLLIEEYSPAFAREIVTLVSGSLEASESLEEAANRELQEELGYHAGRLDFLGELHPFKYLTTRVFVFLARELAPSKLPGDESHRIAERRVPLAGSMALCQAGVLQDACAIAALHLAREFLGHALERNC